MRTNHETIAVDVSDQVATITLNRPARLNAYTPQMGIELFSAIAELDQSDDVRAIVVTGAGRAFCAGADLEAGASTFATDNVWQRANEAESRVRPWNMLTPVIAAINGPAVGIGATMPLWWDIRVASDQAKIGFLFTRRGISPEAHSTWILPRMVGLSRAADLLLTGRMVTADEALRMGLVSRVIPHDDLLSAAREIALDIAANTGPVSVAATRRLLWRQLMETDPRRAKSLEDELFQWIGKQPDAAEGVSAFLEKRAPSWSMSPARDMPPAMGALAEEPVMILEEVENAPATERSDTTGVISSVMRPYRER